MVLGVPNVKTNARADRPHRAHYEAHATEMENAPAKRTTTVLPAVKNVIATQANATMEQLVMEHVLRVNLFSMAQHAKEYVIATQASATILSPEMEAVPVFPTFMVLRAIKNVIRATQAHATMGHLVMGHVHVIGCFNLVAAAVHFQPWAVSLVFLYY